MVINIRLLIVLVFISNLLLAQNESKIVQFNKALNQFQNVRDFCLSQDGTEAFFTIQSPNQEISQLAYIKKENNRWTKPELLPFNDSYKYLEPFLSLDNNRLFFVSDRPLNDTINRTKDFDIWYVDRNNKDDKWSNPKNLGPPINSKLDEFYPSVSEKNNLYFTMVSPNGVGKDDLYFCKWENGKYSKPMLLEKTVNTTGYEFNAFISAKENYIIFSRYNEKDGQGSGDLYISRKEENGKWGKAKNLGAPINTKYMEYCPFYDERNQLLYFTSKRSDMKSRKFTNISDFKNYVNQGHNGLSKIYMTLLNIE